MEGLTFKDFGREVRMREENRGVEDHLLGTTIEAEGYRFAVLDDMMLFDGDDITTPVGMESIEWLSSLTPDFVDEIEPETFQHGS